MKWPLPADRVVALLAALGALAAVALGEPRCAAALAVLLGAPAAVNLELK